MDKKEFSERVFYKTGWDDPEIAKAYKNDESPEAERMRGNLYRILSVIGEVDKNKDYLASVEDKGKLVVDLARRKLEGKTVLDIGCGPGGDLEKEILPAVKTLITLDKAQHMLDLLIKDPDIAKYKEKVLPVRGNMNALPIAENSVDLAVAAHATDYLRDENEEDEFLTGVMSALKPGGSLILTSVYNSESGMTEKGFESSKNRELFNLSRLSLKETARDFVFMDSQIQEKLKKLGFETEVEPFFVEKNKTHIIVKITKKPKKENETEIN